MNTEDNKELKLLRSKVKYLEDRIEVMTKSLGKINNILGRFQMTENNDTAQGFKDIDIHESVGGGFSLDNNNELI